MIDYKNMIKWNVVRRPNSDEEKEKTRELHTYTLPTGREHLIYFVDRKTGAILAGYYLPKERSFVGGDRHYYCNDVHMWAEHPHDNKE